MNFAHDIAHTSTPQKAIAVAMPIQPAAISHERNRRDDAASSEREDDWELEARIFSGGKGVQRRKANHALGWKSYRYRVMSWEERDGFWYGRWRWGEWETGSAHEGPHNDSKRGIGATDASGIPTETLFNIIECVTGSKLTAGIEVEDAARGERWLSDGEGLMQLALVCRAWYGYIAPALYSTLEVTETNRGSCLRPATAAHARRIAFIDSHPLAANVKLPQLPPREFLSTLWLRWSGPLTEAKCTLSYHPSHAQVHLRAHSALFNVSRLDLWYCDFLSSLDLLRLLAAFPNLVRVDLGCVKVARGGPPSAPSASYDSATADPGRQRMRAAAPSFSYARP